MIENAVFACYLDQFPELRGLVEDYYYSRYASCMSSFAALMVCHGDGDGDGDGNGESGLVILLV